MDQRYQLECALADTGADILGSYSSDLEILRGNYADLRENFAKTRQRFAELVVSFQEEIDTYQERLKNIRECGQELYGTLLDELADADVDVEDYPLPEPDLLDESNDLLYDSQRDYFEQLVYYKNYRSAI